MTHFDKEKVSSIEFVMSQIQIAVSSEGATGRKISAFEIEKRFGLSALEEIYEDGYYRLVDSLGVSAQKIKEKRENLSFSINDVALFTKLPQETIIDAENPKKIIKIRDLEKICYVLAIDINTVSRKKGDKSNDFPAVRLRNYKEYTNERSLSKTTISHFCEAASTIKEQTYLMKLLEEQQTSFLDKKSEIDDLYLSGKSRSPKTPWEEGYDLARKTRLMLGISENESIKSVTDLVENKLNIPLIKDDINENIAGATIAYSGGRGIFINTGSKYNNAWVQRVTLCHELCHNLWDNDRELKNLQINKSNYQSIQVQKKDDMPYIEARANAFAIEFLAPQKAIKDLAKNKIKIELLNEVMSTFGVSYQAARHHIYNATFIEIDASREELAKPEDEWNGRENMQLDYFPVKSIPRKKWGKFIYYVTKCLNKKIITQDTAASMLMCDPKEIERVERLSADIYKL